jgi:hypothetical protein
MKVFLTVKASDFPQCDIGAQKKHGKNAENLQQNLDGVPFML